MKSRVQHLLSVNCSINFKLLKMDDDTNGIEMVKISKPESPLQLCPQARCERNKNITRGHPKTYGSVCNTDPLPPDVLVSAG